MEIGNATLYLGDCREILPTLPKVDAVVTDPPYGIDYLASQPGAVEHERIRNDDAGLDLDCVLRFNGAVLSWGANCYPSQLPHRGRWVCWDKRGGIEKADRMLGSPFELAWTNKTSGYNHMIRLLHGGVVNNDSANERRLHPTQKPVRLMERCILLFEGAQSVLDPFMGSGTTGVACANLGREFIGIEIVPEYFEVACERIKAAQSQQRLFA